MGVILAEDLTQGLATAVATTVDPSEPPVAPAHQPSLFPADEVAGLPDGAIEQRRALKTRGPGRPRGAINKTTAAWRDHLLTRYSSPLEFLAQCYSRPVHILAAELGCTLLEAFNLQQRAAAELAPYIHGKMPVEVKVDSELPMIQMVDPRIFLATVAAGEAGAMTPNLADLIPITESVENQQLGATDESRVGQPEFDNAGKAEEIQGVGEAEPLITDQPDGGRDGAA